MADFAAFAEAVGRNLGWPASTVLSDYCPMTYSGPDYWTYPLFLDDENVPATILIGPDGKVVAKDLWYHEIGKAVGEALGRADK